MKFTDAASADVSFTRRLVGFDRQEVRAFVANLLDDYERTRQELERHRHGEPSGHGAPLLPAPEATSREVQRILTGAHKVADEIEQRAAEEGARALVDSQARAAEILAGAERRAVEITEEARRELARLEAAAASLREHCHKLRATFEAAADTAGSALSEIAAVGAGDEARPRRLVTT